ncbi:hypothetical protein GcM3_011020, partial [Golovinomyces cichoracearum]
MTEFDSMNSDSNFPALSMDTRPTPPPAPAAQLSSPTILTTPLITTFTSSTTNNSTAKTSRPLPTSVPPSKRAAPQAVNTIKP